MIRKVKYYAIVFLIHLSCISYAQDTLEIKGLGTTFIVVGSIGNKVEKGKCPCSVPSKGRCSLFEFKIQNVIYHFENNAFSKDELLSIDKILIKNSVSLEQGENYVFTLQPGASKSYIQYTDTLKINPELVYRIIHKHGYFSDIFKCEGQKSPFNDY